MTKRFYDLTVSKSIKMPQANCPLSIQMHCFCQKLMRVGFVECLLLNSNRSLKMLYFSKNKTRQFAINILKTLLILVRNEIGQ